MEWVNEHAPSIPQAVGTLEQLSFKFGNVVINPFLVLKAITIICIALWLASFAMRVMDRRLRRVTEMRASTRTLIMKIFQIVLYCIIFVTGMQLLGINLTALSVFGGALGVGIGFGLQKIASNFISGIILLFEKSIESGDLIELADGTVGQVKRTYARYTLLDLQDGREMLIPNEEFISQRVTTLTHTDKFARVAIKVNVAYGSDFELVRQLMLDAANNHPARITRRPSLCALNAFGDFGVEMLLYFWVTDVTEGRAQPKSDVMRAILLAFKEHDITIPYPLREVRMTNVTPPTPAHESEPSPALSTKGKPA